MNTLTHFKNLENKGYFVFGEPQVQTFYKNGELNYRLFLTHKNNGVDFILSEGLIADEKLFLSAFLNADEGIARPSLYSVESFLNKYSKSDIHCLVEAPNLKLEYFSIFGNSASQTKNLTFYIVKNILSNDVHCETSSPKNSSCCETGLKAHDDALYFIQNSFEALNKPEHVSHLARLHYLNIDERMDLLAFPYLYLLKAFQPVQPYQSMNIPMLDHDYSKPITLRTNSFLN